VILVMYPFCYIGTPPDVPPARVALTHSTFTGGTWLWNRKDAASAYMFPSL